MHLEIIPNDRSGNHRPHSGRRTNRRRGVRVCHAAQTRSELCRALPVSQRKDTFFQRISRQRALQVFQLRKRRKCRALHHGARTDDLLRGLEVSGQEIQHRDTGKGADRRGETSAIVARKPVHRQQLCPRLFSGDTEESRRRAQRRHGLSPPTRIPRRHYREIPTRILHRKPRRNDAGGSAQRVQERVSREDGHLLRNRRPPAARPFLGTRHLSRAYAFGQGGGFRRTGVEQRNEGRESEIRQFARIGNIP